MAASTSQPIALGKSTVTNNPSFSFSFGSSKPETPSLSQATSASGSGFSFNIGGNHNNQPQAQAPFKIGGSTTAQPSVSFNSIASNASSLPASTSHPPFGVKNVQQPVNNNTPAPTSTLPQPQLFNNNQAAQQQKPPVIQLNVNTAKAPSVTSTPPSQTGPTSLFQQQNQQQQFSTPNQVPPQFMPQSQPQQAQQLQQLQQQPAQKQMSTPVGKQPQMQQPHQLQQDSVRRVRDFIGELDEFRTNVAKLFSGKDLSKQLLNLSIIKDTKKMEQTYLSLIDEMKVNIFYLEIILMN
jgi:hypothetical protein